MEMLNREEILSKKDLKKEKVFVEEWGGDVIVSEMSGAERDAWEQWMSRKKKGEIVQNIRARLVVASVVDANGNRIFADEHIEKVGELSSNALEKVCEVADRLNGLTDAALQEAKGN